MKIILLNPATIFPYNYPHMGLAYISSILKRAGHNVYCIDGSAPYRSHTNEELVAECIKLRPDVIGVTAATERVKFAYHLLCLLKNNLPAVPIIAGGPHATVRPIEMVALGFDVAVVGPAEGRIDRIAEAAHDKDIRSLDKISGIAFHKPGIGIVLTPPGSEENDFDINTLLPVDFSCFNKGDYLRKQSDNYRYGALFVGRGCPGRCLYCDRSVFGRKLKIASADKIIADMIMRRNNYNVNNFIFLDDTLLWNKAVLEELCDKLSASPELADITWGCNARANLTDRGMLAKMKQAGCDLIILGVESGDPETLLRIKKGIRLETMLACIDAILTENIRVTVNLMNGFPWQNVDTLKAQMSLVQMLKSKGVSAINAGFTVFPFPRTELFEKYLGQGYEFYNWWLRDDFFEKNNSSSLRKKTPYYQKLVAAEIRIIDSEDFFGLYRDAEMRKTMESFLNDIQSFNLDKRDSRFLKHRSVRWMVRLAGNALYRFSPAVEEWVWRKLA